MKTMRYMMALLAMGAIATACSVKTTDSTDDDDGSGGAGGTTNAAATGTSVASTSIAASSTVASTVASTTAATGGGGQDPICDSGFALSGGNTACAQCLSMNCCDEFKACFADQSCNDCFIKEQGMGAGCDATMLDEAANTCLTTSCSSECG